MTPAARASTSASTSSAPPTWPRTSPRWPLKGRLVEVGTLSGAAADIDLGVVLRKRLHLVGTALRARPLEEKIAATRLFAERALPQLARGLVRPIVDRVFPLDAAGRRPPLHGVRRRLRQDRDPNRRRVVPVLYVA